MKLFLIRHAEADGSSELISSDDYKYITPEGRKLTRKIAKKLKDEFEHLDVIYTSPLVRAVQTSEVIASKIKFKKDLIVSELLSGKYETFKIIDLIKSKLDMNSIAMVGHEPIMSNLVASLSDNKNFNGFSKSGVCLLKLIPDMEVGKFIWYFNPKNFEFEK